MMRSQHTKSAQPLHDAMRSIACMHYASIDVSTPPKPHTTTNKHKTQHMQEPMRAWALEPCCYRPGCQPARPLQAQQATRHVQDSQSQGSLRYYQAVNEYMEGTGADVVTHGHTYKTCAAACSTTPSTAHSPAQTQLGSSAAAGKHR
jgi:hypothetical protein